MADASEGLDPDPDHKGLWKNLLQAAFGSDVEPFNQKLMDDLFPCFWIRTSGQDPQEAKNQGLMAAAAALTAFKPKDEIEGMLAAQAVALHAASIECLRRAMLSQQPAEVASKLRKDGANMARAMTDMLDALDRKRGKGSQQVVRVERVMIAEGGQAIVGNVTAAQTEQPRPQAPVQAIGQASTMPMDVVRDLETVGAGG